MHARVTHTKLRKENFEAATEFWTRYMSPFKGRGLLAGYMLIERSTGAMCNITIWQDSKSQEEFARSDERQAAYPHMVKFFEEPFTLSVFEVTASIVDT